VEILCGRTEVSLNVGLEDGELHYKQIIFSLQRAVDIQLVYLYTERKNVISETFQYYKW